MMQDKKYGLFTAITMITGIVIGSGIFFKADDVLLYTNGNMLLGIVVFIVAAFAIIFGSLTISQLAAKTDTPGGIIGYFEKFVNREAASAFGWYEMFIYFAAINGVVAWVTGLFWCQLFGLEQTPLRSSILGAITLLVIFVINVLSAALGGIVQNAAMIIKLIPLILIAVFGLIFGQPLEILKDDFMALPRMENSTTWLAAFFPIAFSYDGWSIATTICHKIKNSKKNLPIALIVAPIIVLISYVLFFVGLTSLLGVDKVITEGNNSVFIAANQVFGSIGGNLILVFVIISMIGTLNGLTLAFIQLPYSLALRKMLPCSNLLTRTCKQLGGMPIYSAFVAIFLSGIWMLINYVTQSKAMLGDVSEIPIVISYFMYIVLYITVINLCKKGEIPGRFYGFVVPVLAIAGSLIITAGAISHPAFWIFAVVSVFLCSCGYVYAKRNQP